LKPNRTPRWQPRGLPEAGELKFESNDQLRNSEI